MIKYKLGDKVQVKPDLEDYDNGPGVGRDMHEACGKIYTIRRVLGLGEADESGMNYCLYLLAGLPASNYTWDERWLDPVYEGPIMELI
jgi:hypothetical protein